MSENFVFWVLFEVLWLCYLYIEMFKKCINFRLDEVNRVIVYFF